MFSEINVSNSPAVSELKCIYICCNTGKLNLNWPEGSNLRVRAPLSTCICKKRVQESGAETECDAIE